MLGAEIAGQAGSAFQYQCYNVCSAASLKFGTQRIDFTQRNFGVQEYSKHIVRMSGVYS